LRPSFSGVLSRFQLDRSGGFVMPYKDPQKKIEWERQHRSQRLARRRELRQIETAWKEAHPGAIRVQGTAASFLLPLAAGGVLAAYDSKLAMGAGGLTLLVATAYKKDWRWWIAGLLILAVGLFAQWTKQSAKE
jgi:hypothetical protein